MRPQIPDASFSFIRYAAVWEDADLLLAALRPQPSQNVLCICSAGDNALALLTRAPAQVEAIDLSDAQLHLAALKKAAFGTLDFDDLLLFLADASSVHQKLRLQLFEEKVRAALPADTLMFWEARRQDIANGVLESGKFEKYFRAFRRWFLPLTHTKGEIQELLRPKTDNEQADFYQKHWANYRWRALMNIFFSRFVLGRYGRDPAFLKHVKIPVSEFIRSRAEQHLQSADCTGNPFLHRIFTGNYGLALPFYLRPENFEAIRTNLDRLQFRKIDALTAMKQKPFDAYALSNIFEYQSEVQFQNFVDEAIPHIPVGARTAFWNLMAPRSFSGVAPTHFRNNPEAVVLPPDKGFFYSRFLLETRI